MTNLPRYKSHKIVEAVKIARMHTNSNLNGLFWITPEESGIKVFTVADSYVKKHDPRVGGYYVRYPDGYESWSPAEAFEEGYTRVEDEPKTVGFGIGRAVKEMQKGASVRRAGWKGKVRYIDTGASATFTENDGTVLQWQPYVAMKTAQGTMVPWLCSQTDLLAIDWEISD